MGGCAGGGGVTYVPGQCINICMNSTGQMVIGVDINCIQGQLGTSGGTLPGGTLTIGSPTATQACLTLQNTGGEMEICLDPANGSLEVINGKGTPVVWVTQLGQVVVGGDGTPQTGMLNVIDETIATSPYAQGIDCHRYSNDPAGPTWYSYKSRGTHASPLPIQAGDWLVYFGWGGLSAAQGNAGGNQGSFRAITNPDALTADLIFTTNDGTDTQGDGYERLRITALGQIICGGTAGAIVPTGMLSVVDQTLATSPYGQGIESRRYSNDSVGATWYSWKARGTLQSELPIQAGDWLMYFGWGGPSSAPGDAGGNQGSFRAITNADASTADLIFTVNDGTDGTGDGQERLRLAGHGPAVQVTGTLAIVPAGGGPSVVLSNDGNGNLLVNGSPI